ncbi:cholinesterase-like isoform X1 [Alosa sapidissima]|uniref:cholinesterase-like isoform X1 n=2 Tax=Alosa sapidissima TaxID=34773 RepID=UPI001C0A5ADA|nr:cholinesterase-like isoform X1 [Alosa sapidissima]
MLAKVQMECGGYEMKKKSPRMRCIGYNYLPIMGCLKSAALTVAEKYQVFLIYSLDINPLMDVKQPCLRLSNLVEKTGRVLVERRRRECCCCLQLTAITMGCLLLRLMLGLLFLQLLCLSEGRDELFASTKYGKVRGVQLPVPNGNVLGSVVAFLGIPYAKPPLSELRFRPPQDPKPWTGVRDATQFANSCYQPVDNMFPGFSGAEMWNPNTAQNEDCLYLNVWVPSPTPQEPAPVMVWIHGGGFQSGTPSLDLYDGRFLSHSEGVVVVSMSYRVGALGFLALPDSDIRGNAGLFDQRHALLWVKENIAAFGGNASSVTLFGESAGSASVGFHLLSTGSHALFSRAILQGGSPNAVWAALPPPQAQNNSLALANLLNCPRDVPISVTEACLQNADPKEIIKHQSSVSTCYSMICDATVSLPFAPTVDGNFLTDMPVVLLESGQFLKTDILLGLNKDEGSYLVLYGSPGFSLEGESLISRDQFQQGVARTLPEFSEVSQQAAAFMYTDWTDENDGQKNRDGLSSLSGDYYIKCPVLKFTRNYVLHGGKARLFLFDHRSSVNPWPQWMGVMHGYDIEFVFGLPLNANLGYTKEEVDMSRKFMRHWANFARTGDPGTEGSAWPLFSTEQQEYLTLNADAPQTHRKMKAQQCKFWDSFLPKLQRSTAGIDEVESQWKTQFHRWLSYMLDWRKISKDQQCDFKN